MLGLGLPSSLEEQEAGKPHDLWNMQFMKHMLVFLSSECLSCWWTGASLGLSACVHVPLCIHEPSDGFSPRPCFSYGPHLSMENERLPDDQAAVLSPVRSSRPKPLLKNVTLSLWTFGLILQCAQCTPHSTQLITSCHFFHYHMLCSPDWGCLGFINSLDKLPAKMNKEELYSLTQAEIFWKVKIPAEFF